MLDNQGFIIPKGQRIELMPYVPRLFKSYEIMSDQELYDGRGGIMMVDSESYPNYALIAFKDIKTDKYLKFPIDQFNELNKKKLSWIMHEYTTVGFNSIKYDLQIIWLAYAFADCQLIKDASDALIFNQVWPTELQKQYSFQVFPTRHIDLIEVCPLKGSLKLYGARLHAKRIQDLPLAVNRLISKEEIEIVDDYCLNDLDTTEVLFNNLTEPLKLRNDLSREYKQDLMSKSDAQIAEAVIATELRNLGRWAGKPKSVNNQITYKAPAFIFFQNDQLKKVFEAICTAPYTLADNGYVELPKEVEGLKIAIGNSIYRIGNGGLHSSEKQTFIKSDDEFEICDKDVASYYPAIILNCNLYPQHLGIDFLTVYRNIVNRRLEAKKAKNISVSECLKITINGTFGKLGSPHSILYAPDLMLQVTITGQLALLMLIEQLELNGIPIYSANTDGIVIRCPKAKKDEMNAIVKQWEQITGFITEDTTYTAIYSRDVNAYMAVKASKEIKGKNLYYDPWRGKTGKDQYWKFQKNPTVQICVEAIEKLLTDGIPIEQTIKECGDITKFVAIKNVKGGAHKDGYYLGKVVRWYYARNTVGTINYIETGNVVSETLGAKPCMDLPDKLPDDINYDFYINKTIDMLYSIGYYKKEEQLHFF